MKQFLLLLAVFWVLTALTGCETVKGVGRDITGAGASVQDALSHHK